MTGTRTVGKPEGTLSPVVSPARPPSSGAKPSTAGAASTDLTSEILTMDQAIALLQTTRPRLPLAAGGEDQEHEGGAAMALSPETSSDSMKGEQPRIELTTDITPLLKTLTEALARTRARNRTAEYQSR